MGHQHPWAPPTPKSGDQGRLPGRPPDQGSRSPLPPRDPGTREASWHLAASRGAQWQAIPHPASGCKPVLGTRQVPLQALGPTVCQTDPEPLPAHPSPWTWVGAVLAPTYVHQGGKKSLLTAPGPAGVGFPTWVPCLPLRPAPGSQLGTACPYQLLLQPLQLSPPGSRSSPATCAHPGP